MYTHVCVVRVEEGCAPFSSDDHIVYMYTLCIHICIYMCIYMCVWVLLRKAVLHSVVMSICDIKCGETCATCRYNILCYV